MIRVPSVNGARGATLLGFALVAFTFGLAFFSPIAIIPPPPPGLVLLNELVSLEWWGLGWYLAGLFLLVGAFRQDQSWALMPFAGLLAVWAISYIWSATSEHNAVLATKFIMQSAMFGGVLTACLGIARLVNAPPVNVDGIREKVLTDELEGKSGDEPR